MPGGLPGRFSCLQASGRGREKRSLSDLQAQSGVTTPVFQVRRTSQASLPCPKHHQIRLCQPHPGPCKEEWWGSVAMTNQGKSHPYRALAR